MKKYNTLRVLIIGCLLIGVLVSLYFNNPLLGNFMQRDVDQALNEKEIDDFIRGVDEEIISVGTLYGKYTVCVFGDLDHRGYYEVYKRNGVITKGRKVVSSGDWRSMGPIVFSGGTASGDYPFTIMYVLDNALLNQSNTIEIIADKGRVKVSEVSNGILLRIREIGNITGYKVYDKNGNVILDSVEE